MNDGFFLSGGAYDFKRDGPLKKYFETHDGLNCFPLFRGFEIYDELWDEGWLCPLQSNVRVMWGLGRGDEHYGVLSKTELEGTELKYHSGKAGIYFPKEILSQGPNWEVGKAASSHLTREERIILQKELIDLMAQIRAKED
jgi:hypothetical protein